MTALPDDVRSSLKTDAATSLFAAAFAVFGDVHAVVSALSPSTSLAVVLVGVPLGSYFSLGRSSPRVAEALGHRGVRFAFIASFTLAAVFLVLRASPPVRLGVVSFLVGTAATNWYLHSVVGVEYVGDDGSVFAS
ncbi:hypothetical protein [Halogeometricum limi]|uniref:Uncharacterized protein n=1 Tax=Halogeometricum limi TaxID=555875 RepID=A0A1I6HBB3_9EURY|nr:hypothetical protein [Halogeometricum limi]SFR51775.1 hypothetical protein SAMN04488124_2017 [Halogeometricum limi]